MGKIEVTLMNKDRPVMYLSGELKPASDKSRISAFVAEKAKFDAENKKFLPVIINKEEIMIKTFNEWFRKRIISDRRMDVPDTPIDWRDGLPHYFSLSDQYWLRYNENETYKNLNFFTNGYKLLQMDISSLREIRCLQKIKVCLIRHRCIIIHLMLQRTVL